MGGGVGVGEGVNEVHYGHGKKKPGNMAGRG